MITKKPWDFPVKKSITEEPKAQEQALEKNPFASIDDQIDGAVPTATLQIYQGIDEKLGRKEVDTHVNRASSATLCHKRRWYQRRGLPGEKLTPRKLINFLLGDLSEIAHRHYVHEFLVGPGKMYSEVDFGTPTGTFEANGKTITIYKQADLVANIGGIQVTAHVDGWGKRNSDGQWELIEFKSSSNFGFDEFRKIGTSDYLKQAMVNLQTNRALELGAREVRFYYLRKETGHLWDRLYSFDQDLANDVAEEFRLANAEAEPPAPYFPKLETERKKPTGRKVLDFPCTYCPYKHHCHAGITVEFKEAFGKSYPVYVVGKTEGETA